VLTLTIDLASEGVMAAQPSNFFQSLAGIPVLYDRLKPEHYGKIGIPHRFHCTNETQDVLEALFQDLFARTTPHFGAAERILSAGAWVDKPGQHGLGRAFDLDAIHWRRVRFVALEQPVHKQLYLAVQALCNKHCGIVLGYDYNPAHHDHLHVDTGRDVRFREANSVVSFLQQALNALYGHTLSVDGEFGPNTERALNDTLATLGIAGVSAVADWKRFLDAVCTEAISRVAAALDAEGAARSSAATTAAIAAMADSETDPSLPAAQELYVAPQAVLAARPDTGRIDLDYKPFANWAVNSRIVGNTEQWFADFDDVSQFYLGYRFAFESRYVGLARTGSSGATQVPYDHAFYRANSASGHRSSIPPGAARARLSSWS
jgi:hypothetical protein